MNKLPVKHSRGPEDEGSSWSLCYHPSCSRQKATHTQSWICRGLNGPFRRVLRLTGQEIPAAAPLTNSDSDSDSDTGPVTPRSLDLEASLTDPFSPRVNCAGHLGKPYSDALRRQQPGAHGLHHQRHSELPVQRSGGAEGGGTARLRLEERFQPHRPDPTNVQPVRRGTTLLLLLCPQTIDANRQGGWNVSSRRPNIQQIIGCGAFGFVSFVPTSVVSLVK